MSVAIIIFAKAPQAGLAKTRLIPSLGPDGAAHLAERMLFHTVEQAMNTGFDHIELCVTPDTTHTAFQTLARLNGKHLLLSRQSDGDLGERMHTALKRTLSAHSSVLLVGTDAPALTTDVLARASLALRTHQAVFVPATDGGYVLAGFTQAYEPLFARMPWSTAQVMQETRRRMQAAGWRWKELPAITDIDEPPDLAHAPPQWLR
jgi:hypothetical protein